MKKNVTTKVAVTSRSFSKHPELRRALLERYTEVKFNDAGAALSGDSLVDFLKEQEKAITALERIDTSVLSRLPDLKVISKYGVGLDMIDMAALKQQGVRLGWTGGVNRRSVAELALCFAIACLRKVPESLALVREGGWKQIQGRQLTGKAIGIIGCGHVGKEFVALLRPFNCRVLIHDILDVSAFCRENNATQVPLDVVMKESDVISLHVPLDVSTQSLLNRERLSCMKPGAVLINTARGGIVDESALKEMLLSKHLSGAAFDVFNGEPPEDLELLRLPNFMATPHIGGSAEEAVLAMGLSAIEGLERAETIA